MKKYQCSCGKTIYIDGSSKTCPSCGDRISLDTDVSGNLQHTLDESSQRLKTLADEAASDLGTVVSEESVAVNGPGYTQKAPVNSQNTGYTQRGTSTGKYTGYTQRDTSAGKNTGHPHTDTSTAHNAATAQKESDFKNLTRLVELYETNGNSTRIYEALTSMDETMIFADMETVWRPFFIRVAHAASLRNDKELQVYLKNLAIEYDEKREGSHFFYAMLLACPKLGNNNDWADLISSTNGDRKAFSKICDSIIRYITEARDKAFAIEIFDIMKAKSKKNKEWEALCADYARALFTSDKIAADVFTWKAFKSAAARRFIRKVKKYCTHIAAVSSVAIEEAKVWKNYLLYLKKRKAQRAFTVLAVLCLIVGVLIAANVYMRSVNPETVDFTVDELLEVTYGNTLSLDGYHLTYRTNAGEKGQEDLTSKMLFGYDPEKVGVQQEAYFEYMGIKKSVTIVVKAAQLEKPKLTQSGNLVKWESVPHAESYAIFVNASEVKTNETSSLSYDLSATAAFGELTVMVRAMTSSGKYVSSEMSDPLTVTKLEAPKNIEYVSGKLIWTAVEGATGYELTVNGVPYVTSAPECTLTLNRGDNEITVIAKSSDKAVIHGITLKQSMYYNRLDPITAMSYRDGSVYWEAGADAKMFRVYVDGVQWKDFSRNYFSYELDGFAQAFGGGTHKIEIVCMTSVSGVESSETKGYNVVFNNKVTMSDGIIQWNNIGIGSTYFVYVNGTLHTYRDSYFSASDCVWQNGNNEVTILAKLNGEDYICESFTVKKHSTPALSATDAGWIAENSGYELYSINGGQWTDTLPDIMTLLPGTYTVKVKRVVSSQDAFELESDMAQITVIKPATPTIKVVGGMLETGTFDSETFRLVLEYFDADISSWITISSVSEIVNEGSYRLRARLRANTASGNFILSSDPSAELNVFKPKTPEVYYDREAGMLSSDVSGVKFYYVDDNGQEREIIGGKTSNLPSGVFSVYARLNATEPNTLHSENTPISKRASVFNLNIDFTVNVLAAGSNQCYFVFGGCSEIDSITYSYKINYLDAAGQVIGGIDKSGAFRTQTKESSGSDIIRSLINFRAEGVFSGNYTHSDVSRIEVTVYIDGGAETLPKTNTATVK